MYFTHDWWSGSESAMMVSTEEGICALILLCLLNSCTSASDWNKTIHLAPNGHDTDSCGSESNPCRTLDHAFERLANNSTRFLLQQGTYNLSSSRNVTRVSDFAIVGLEDVEVNCSPNSSLAFLLTSNIVLQGIKFRQCGSLHQSTVVYSEHKYPTFVSALYFNYCKNLRVSRVQVVGTPGVGLTLYNVAGTVNISESVFSENRAPVNESHNSTHAISGGGIFFGLTTALDIPTSFIPTDYSTYGSNNVFVFENSNFSGNVAPTAAFEGDYQHPSVPFTRGGGLAIFLAGNSSNNTFQIRSCEFRKNIAGWGGGLQVEFGDRSQNNNVSIEDTLFDGNKALLAGGGARVGTLIKVDEKLLYNNFYFTRCVFRNNHAQWGGGAAVYGTTRPSPQWKGHIGKVASFRECNWRGNRGLVGSAIGAYLVNLNEDDIGPRVPFHLELKNCNISNNVVLPPSNGSVEVGQGAVYTVEVPVVLSGLTSIRSNTKTAMVLDSSTLEVDDQVYFTENSGYRGGALALYGRSKVVLQRNSSLFFNSNRAYEKGGAMYVNAPGSPLANFESAGISVHACFFAYAELEVKKYDEWQTEVVFEGNTAPSASGRSVYATTLKNCISAGETRSKNTALQWRFIKFRDHDANTTDEVVTDPIDIQLHTTDWQVTPSQEFNATVRLIDEKGHDINGMVHISIHQSASASASLATPSDLFLVSNSRIIYLKLKGNIDEKFSVSVRTVGVQLVRNEINNLTLRQCNPGFYWKDSQCVCGSGKHDGISRCKKNGVGFYMRIGYWAGTVDGQFVTYQCPDNYCDYSNDSLTANAEYLIPHFVEDSMCRHHRTGILCGKCECGYSVLLGSEDCGEDCSDLWLLLFIPYAVLLFGGVMLVMLINLDAFTGYLNAWLYSYQIMDLLLTPGFKLDVFISFIIGLANIQVKFGGSCLMKKMDDADKLALLYVLPTYILLVVLILAKLVRRHPDWCYSRRVKAPFRAFCTLFVLCYTDITGISLKILHPAALPGIQKIVLFQNGEVEFFHGKHIGYAILAIVYVLLVVIPFPLTLMFTPFFRKCLMPVFNLNNLKPVYDSFQSCFKDQFRWCSAFYFVARLLLLVIATYVPYGYLKRILLEAMCIFVLTVFVYLRPYKEQYNWLNKLDAVMLSNLALITIFASGIDLSVPEKTSKALEVVVKMLSYVPLGYLLVLLIYGAYGYFKERDKNPDGNTAQFKQLADEILTSAEN